MIVECTDQNACFFSIYDLDTEEKIRDVVWVNEEKGEYEQYLRDDKGALIILRDDSGTPFEIKSEVKKGNIRIIDERIDGDLRR